ncbi:hypothetical protein, partial [Escherichia coli]|uniref:hypothetical protein n=1 Tax=Escherichia coli TaxID=562 RepID=UPI001F3F825C
MPWIITGGFLPWIITGGFVPWTNREAKGQCVTAVEGTGPRSSVISVHILFIRKDAKRNNKHYKTN